MKIFMDETLVHNSINKLEMYRKEEDLIFDDLKGMFTNFNYYYKSNNTKFSDKVVSELVNKFKIINSIHNDNLFVLRKNMELYNETRIEVENIFK